MTSAFGVALYHGNSNWNYQVQFQRGGPGGFMDFTSGFRVDLGPISLCCITAGQKRPRTGQPSSSSYCQRCCQGTIQQGH